MSPVVASFNFYLALGGVAAFIIAVILLIDTHRERSLVPFIKTYGLIAAFVVSTGASLAALVYSEVFGFTPCGFCWLERMFLFPQVMLLLGAIYFKDALFARYGLILSGTGLTIALYHHYLQLGGNAFVRCPSAGSVDCAKRILFEFNFITFPLLAATTFFLLGALYYYILRTR